VHDQHIQFGKASWIEQQIQPLARREFASLVLPLNPLGAPPASAASFRRRSSLSLSSIDIA
jgi:hypothetical protein